MNGQNSVTESESFNYDAFESAFQGDGGFEAEPAVEETEPYEADSQKGQEEPAAENQEALEENAAGESDSVELGADGPEPLKLPKEALLQLQSALGADPVGLIQKGIAYDKKAERELRLLGTYAEASGMTMEQYLDALENSIADRKLENEVELARQEFPDTPDEALRVIAQQRREAREAFERQQADERQKEILAGRERINHIIEESRKNAAKNAWAEYEKVSGAHKAEDVPKRVLELVKEGMTPIAAFWRNEAELAKEKAGFRDKERDNALKSAGSMAGAAEQGADPFLRGFYSI